MSACRRQISVEEQNKIKTEYSKQRVWSAYTGQQILSVMVRQMAR